MGSICKCCRRDDCDCAGILPEYVVSVEAGGGPAMDVTVSLRAGMCRHYGAACFKDDPIETWSCSTEGDFDAGSIDASYANSCPTCNGVPKPESHNIEVDEKTGFKLKRYSQNKWDYLVYIVEIPGMPGYRRIVLEVDYQQAYGFAWVEGSYDRYRLLTYPACGPYDSSVLPTAGSWVYNGTDPFPLPDPESPFTDGESCGFYFTEGSFVPFTFTTVYYDRPHCVVFGAGWETESVPALVRDPYFRPSVHIYLSSFGCVPLDANLLTKIKTYYSLPIACDEICGNIVLYLSLPTPETAMSLPPAGTSATSNTTHVSCNGCDVEQLFTIPAFAGSITLNFGAC